MTVVFDAIGGDLHRVHLGDGDGWREPRHVHFAQAAERGGGHVGPAPVEGRAATLLAILGSRIAQVLRLIVGERVALGDAASGLARIAVAVRAAFDIGRRDAQRVGRGVLTALDTGAASAVAEAARTVAALLAEASAVRNFTRAGTFRRANKLTAGAAGHLDGRCQDALAFAAAGVGVVRVANLDLAFSASPADL